MTDDPAHASEPLRGGEVIDLGGLTIRTEREGETHTIALAGELDLATADKVRAALERVEATDVPAIVLDLRGLTFMDSSGIRVLVNAHARSRADGGRLTLLRGGPAVQRVLQLTGVEVMLPFAD